MNKGTFESLIVQTKDSTYDINVVGPSLREFVKTNLDPRHSVNYTSMERDEPIEPILELFVIYKKKYFISLLVMRVLKILSRKKVNREHLTIDTLQKVISYLRDDKILTQICYQRLKTFKDNLLFEEEEGKEQEEILEMEFNPHDVKQVLQIAEEASNFLLNVCYTSTNVYHMINIPHAIDLLLNLMHVSALQNAVAGAIQSICYVKRGKAAVRKAAGIPVLCNVFCVMDKHNQIKGLRIIGALHNLSTDLETAAEMRDQEKFVPALLQSLNALVDMEEVHVDYLASVAGCVQNMSRDDQARAMIKESNAVGSLIQLLVRPHAFTQKCAAGALLNILGPDTEPARTHFKQLLANCIASGQIQDALSFV